MEALEELYDHIRAWHRYEPVDFPGDDFDVIDDNEKLAAYTKTHDGEHDFPRDFWGEDEWAKLEHDKDSRDMEPSEEAASVPMFGEDEASV